MNCNTLWLIHNYIEYFNVLILSDIYFHFKHWLKINVVQNKFKLTYMSIDYV